jgi:hypothetical protein
MGWLYREAKNLIHHVARGVELAAAMIIAIAALETTIKALSLFVRRGAPPDANLTNGRLFCKNQPETCRKEI